MASLYAQGIREPNLDTLGWGKAFEERHIFRIRFVFFSGTVETIAWVHRFGSSFGLYRLKAETCFVYLVRNWSLAFITVR